jgi:hypothetical protein
VRKYFKGIKPGVTISTGITTNLHYNVQTLGFIWSEILQSQKKYDDAVAVLMLIQPDQMVGISLADIEISIGDFDFKTKNRAEAILSAKGANGLVPADAILWVPKK